MGSLWKKPRVGQAFVLLQYGLQKPHKRLQNPNKEGTGLSGIDLVDVRLMHEARLYGLGVRVYGFGQLWGLRV